jgi:hypothetical protein
MTPQRSSSISPTNRASTRAMCVSGVVPGCSHLRTADNGMPSLSAASADQSLGLGR